MEQLLPFNTRDAQRGGGKGVIRQVSPYIYKLAEPLHPELYGDRQLDSTPPPDRTELPMGEGRGGADVAVMKPATGNLVLVRIRAWLDGPGVFRARNWGKGERAG